MRKFLASKMTALALALAVLFGGMVVAAPAQAVYGSYVNYAHCAGTGCDHPVWIDSTDGLHFWLPFGTFTDDVFKVDAYSIGQRLRITGPNGTTRTLNCGESYAPTNPGWYEVKQMSC